MSALIQTCVDAEDIIQAMNEDGSFTVEMWDALADALHRGLLLDNTADLIRMNGFDRSAIRKMQSSFTILADVCEEYLEDA